MSYSRFSSSGKERDMEEGRSLLQRRSGGSNKKKTSNKKSSSSSSKSYQYPTKLAAAATSDPTANLIFAVIVLLILTSAVIGVLFMLQNKADDVAADVARIEYLYHNITVTPTYCLTPNNVDATMLAGWIF